MKRKLLLLLLLCFGAAARAQTGGIEGTVQDKTGDLIMSVFVHLMQNGVVKDSTVTDCDGKFLFKGLNVDEYDVKVSIEGYISELIQDVPVSVDYYTHFTVFIRKMVGPPQDMPTYGPPPTNITRYQRPLIDRRGIR